MILLNKNNDSKTTHNGVKIKLLYKMIINVQVIIIILKYLSFFWNLDIRIINNQKKIITSYNSL